MAMSRGTVASIMSQRVVAVRSDCDLWVAAETMERSALRHLVVVDADRVVRGVLSADQVRVALGAAGRCDPVGDHLPGEPTGVGPGADIRWAAELMLDTLVDAALVVDHVGRVLGVVTWSDIVAHATGHPADVSA
jgi:CBS domain-containing protein